MTMTVAPAATPVFRPRSFRPATFADALRSEWTKLRTVRSTPWALVVAAVLGVGLGALISAVSATHYATDPGLRLNWNPTDRSLRSLEIAQLAFAILGVMVVTGEYSTGMIRTSLAAVPKRSRMLAAKSLVFGTVALVAGEIISFATFFIGQAIIRARRRRQASASTRCFGPSSAPVSIWRCWRCSAWRSGSSCATRPRLSGRASPSCWCCRALPMPCRRPGPGPSRSTGPPTLASR